MIHITQACVNLLERLVDDIDKQIVDEEARNDRARARPPSDAERLALYWERRGALIKHRNELRALYVRITHRDPWKDILL